MKQQAENGTKDYGGWHYELPAVNHVSPIAMRFFLLEKQLIQNKFGLDDAVSNFMPITFSVPKRWAVVASWSWGKLVFHTVTFVLNNQASAMQYSVSKDLLYRSPRDGHFINTVKKYIERDVFLTVLNQNDVNRTTHIVNLDAGEDFGFSMHVFEHFVEQFKIAFPNSSELNEPALVSKMVSYFEFIPQSRRVIITRYSEAHPEFVCGCQYFANEWSNCDLGRLSYTGMFIVWDDFGNIHYLGKPDCELVDPLNEKDVPLE